MSGPAATELPPFRWYSRTGSVDAATAASIATRLPRAERERLASLTPERARLFLRGRALVFDSILQWGEGVDAAHVSLRAVCPRCGGPHGAPMIEGASLVASLSHSGDISVAALADSHLIAAIGIDIEPDDASPERRAAIVGLTSAEPAEALRHWTRVEAALKADGRGLRVDPESVRMSAPRHPLAAASATIAGSPHVYDLFDVPGPEGHLTTVATRSRI